MSRARVTIFVEGRDVDSYVYGRLASAELPAPFQYVLLRADQLPNAGSGGKSSLIKFHDYLRQLGQLRPSLSSTRSVTLFYLDKDIDDIKRTRKRSAHIVYTRSYDIEAEVFRRGDLADALAAVCSLDPAQTRAVVADWRERALDLWREWAEVCLMAQLARVSTYANYGKPSQFNSPASSPAKVDEIRKAHIELFCKIDLPSGAGALVILRAHGVINRRYSEGRADEVFKGKWYAPIIEDLAMQHFAVQVKRSKVFRQRLTSHLAQSLCVDEPWADHYRGPLRALLR